MFNKKILSFVLVLTMVLSLTVGCGIFASATDAESGENVLLSAQDPNADATAPETGAPEETPEEAPEETVEEPVAEEESNGLRTVLTIVQIICAVALVLVVTLQSGKSNGLGAMSGGNETFLAKNKVATFDAKLARLTKWIGGIFLLLTLLLNVLQVI